MSSATSRRAEPPKLQIKRPAVEAAGRGKGKNSVEPLFSKPIWKFGHCDWSPRDTTHICWLYILEVDVSQKRLLQ
jgi:hypothetical protein